MSGGIDDYFPSDDLEEEPEPAPTPVSPASADSKRVSTSRADDILDAFEGVRRKQTVNPSKNCTKCGSQDLVIRGSSLSGGTRTILCRKCRTQIPWVNVQAADVKFGPVSPPDGPYYSAEPKPEINPFQPMFRGKSK